MGDGLGGGVENVVVDEWGLGGLLGASWLWGWVREWGWVGMTVGLVVHVELEFLTNAYG